MTKTIKSANQFSLFDEPAAVQPEPSPAPEPQPKPKPRLILIEHLENGVVIEQRPDDGYVNATAMCRAYGKEFKHYREVDTNTAFLERLGLKVGIATFELVQSRRGRYGGTWVHPHVAWHLAQWISSDFAVAVVQWLEDWWQGRRATIGDDDCFEVRRLLEHLSEGVELANQRLAQMGPMLSETWQAQIHTAYRDSLRAEQVAPPSYTGKRQLGVKSGLPPLAQPRQEFKGPPNRNYRKGE